MISPRLPCISPCMSNPECSKAFCADATRTPILIVGLQSSAATAAPSCLQPLEGEAGVGAAESKRIRQNAAERHVIAPLAHDRHVGERRIHGLDVGALADEAVLHHQQAVD